MSTGSPDLQQAKLSNRGVESSMNLHGFFMRCYRAALHTVVHFLQLLDLWNW